MVNGVCLCIDYNINVITVSPLIPVAVCVMNRALDINMHCVEAMVYQILQMLCREGNFAEVMYS